MADYKNYRNTPPEQRETCVYVYQAKPRLINIQALPEAQRRKLWQGMKAKSPELVAGMSDPFLTELLEKFPGSFRAMTDDKIKELIE